jgi:hypothetical protein
MQESKRGALTVNASIDDKTGDEIEDEMKDETEDKTEDETEKRRARRRRVARDSATRACGCRVLMNPEPARRCRSRTPAGVVPLAEGSA